MQPQSSADAISFDRFRGYLALLARWLWNPRLQGKLDPSDVVQQALVQAWQGREAFRGETDFETRSWLRKILERCLADMARDYARDKRDVGRERSLADVLDESSARLEAWLDDQQSSPQERAERQEQILQLAEALAALPEPQQEAVTWHHLHGLSVAEIAALMERTSAAVAGLLKRGLRTLRNQLDSETQR